MAYSALADRLADGTRLPPPAPDPEDDYEEIRRSDLRTRLVKAGVPLTDTGTDRDILSDLAREIEIYLRGLTIAQLACLTYGHKWPELIPVPGARPPKGFRAVLSAQVNGVYLVTEECTRRIIIGAGRAREVSECGTVRKSQTLPPENGVLGLFDRGHMRQYAYDGNIWEKRPEGSRLTRIDFLNETYRRMGRQLFPGEYENEEAG